MTRRCPSCGQALSTQAVRFCVACGKTLPTDGEQPPVTQTGKNASPTAEKTHTRRRNRANFGWIAAITAFVALAAGGSSALILLNSHHRGRNVSAPVVIPAHVSQRAPAPVTSSSVGSQQTELTEITPLIRQSAIARRAVVKASQQVGACTMPPAQGISVMNQAIAQRQAIIGSIGALPVDAIPNGQELLADLKQATAQSILADQGFIGWMQDMQNAASCPIDTSQDSSYRAGLQASAQAVRAKQEFAALWNPLATDLGQPTFTAAQI